MVCMIRRGRMTRRDVPRSRRSGNGHREGSGDPEMASELVHRLQTEFDSAEAESCASLLDGWVELSQGQHRLPGGLFVEVIVTRKRAGSSSASEP